MTDRLIKKTIDPDRESHGNDIFLLRCKLGKEYLTIYPWASGRCSCAGNGKHHGLRLVLDESHKPVTVGKVDADKTCHRQ